MGNHDLRVGKRFYLDLGFIEVYKTKYELDRYVFTHKPIEVSPDKINIYGHIHNKPIEPQFDDSNHMCVCLEKTQYKPILLIDYDQNNQESEKYIKKRIRTK